MNPTITIHPNPDRGVTNLMYLGDPDALNRALGEAELAQQVPKFLALGALGLLIWYSIKRRG